MILAGFAAGVLVDGFGTLIAKSFVMTGRVFDSGVRRLRQNNRHFLEVFFPGGLERAGDGWKLSVRIRFIHARMRRLLHDSGEWDTEAWGVPINSAHTGYAAACFSARTIKHSESVGVSYTQEERDSIMAVWRYTAYLMGIPETILFTNEAEALALHKNRIHMRAAYRRRVGGHGERAHQLRSFGRGRRGPRCTEDYGGERDIPHLAGAYRRRPRRPNALP